MEEKTKESTSFIKYRHHQDRIVQSMQFFQENQELLDTNIICQGRLFTVIRALVSSLSPYFYKMLKDQRGPTFTVIVNDVPHEIMQKILTFMYKGNVQLEPNEMMDFMAAAEKFDLIKETSKSVKYVKSENSTNNQTKTETEVPTRSVNVSNLKIDEKQGSIVNEQQNNDKEAVTMEARFEFTDEELLIKAENNIEVRIKPEVIKPEADEKITGKKQKRGRKSKYKNLVLNHYNLRNRDKNNGATVKQLEMDVDFEECDARPKSLKKLSSTCLICKQVFPTVYKMKKHIIFVHSQVDDDEKQFLMPSSSGTNFTCDICHKQVKDAKRLYEHRYRVHLLTSRGKRTNIKKYR